MKLSSSQELNVIAIAKRSLSRLENIGVKEGRSGITLINALTLVWIGINDPQASGTNLSAQEIQERRKLLLKNLYLIQRGYNVNRYDRDMGIDTDISTCSAGSFNDVIKILSGLHQDVPFLFVNAKSVNAKAKRLLILAFEKLDRKEKTACAQNWVAEVSPELLLAQPKFDAQGNKITVREWLQTELQKELRSTIEHLRTELVKQFKPDDIHYASIAQNIENLEKKCKNWIDEAFVGFETMDPPNTVKEFLNPTMPVATSSSSAQSSSCSSYSSRSSSSSAMSSCSYASVSSCSYTSLYSSSLGSSAGSMSVMAIAVLPSASSSASSSTAVASAALCAAGTINMDIDEESDEDNDEEMRRGSKNARP